MDLLKAKDLEARLTGAAIGKWTIEALVGFGKSAAVFRATAPFELAAVKIFDDELIERYGGAAQLARIERECGLIGEKHPNLVQILDGGVDSHTGNHFLVMEYLDGPNLKQCLQDVPIDLVGSLITQLADAAKFLEGLGYCHRDIKPENIVLLDKYHRLILLDLGVIRPVSGQHYTLLSRLDPPSVTGTGRR